MADITVRTKEMTGTLTRTTELTSGTQSRVVPMEFNVKSQPTSGSWITFPDGSKFRKPTSYSHRTYGISPGSPQVDDLHHLNDPRVIRKVTSSAGGYSPDILLGSNCPPFGGSISMGKLYSAPSIPKSMENEAVVKALNNLADQKAGIGENLATMHQLLGMLSHPASSLTDLLKSAWRDKSLRQFLRKSVRQIRAEGPLNAAARRYLEYVYGWKPLMSDIYGTIELMKQSGSRPMLLSGRGTSYQSTSPSGGSKDNTGDKSRTTVNSVSEKVKVSCKIFGRIDPNYAGLRTINQLGLLNPVSIAWDVMPWSFVIDWFLPVGPVFNAFTAPAGLSFVSATCSVKTDLSGSYSWYYGNWRGDRYLSGQTSDASGSLYASAYSRKVYGNWPMPGFFFSSDPFRGDRPFKALALAIANLRTLRI